MPNKLLRLALLVVVPAIAIGLALHWSAKGAR